MANNPNVTVTVGFDARGRRFYVMTINETNIRDSSQQKIDLVDEGLPAAGRIVSQVCKLAAGTGTTIDPVLGLSSNPTATSAWLVQNGTAAARVHNVPTAPIPYAGVASFYHRAVPNDATADHAVTTEYIIAEGVTD